MLCDLRETARVLGNLLGCEGLSLVEGHGVGIGAGAWLRGVERLVGRHQFHALCLCRLQLLVLGEQLLVRWLRDQGPLVGLVGDRVVRVLLHGHGCLSRILILVVRRLELLWQQILVRIFVID